jgi:hypothetical protein
VLQCWRRWHHGRLDSGIGLGFRDLKEAFSRRRYATGRANMGGPHVLKGSGLMCDLFENIAGPMAEHIRSSLSYPYCSGATALK